MEHRNKPERKVRAQVFKVVIRNQFARHIGLTLQTEDPVFEIHQPAAFQTQLEQAPRAVEQIQVLHRIKGMAGSAHGVSSLQQRLVEALAVISDQHLEAGKISRERVQQRRLLAVIPHEKLADPETFPIDTANPNKKSAGARASCQPGGLRVEEGPGFGMCARDGAARQRVEQVVG